MGVRDDIAQVIADAVAPVYPAMQVYALPEDVQQLPAIVLMPNEPWVTPNTFGGSGAGTVSWQFIVAIVGTRANPEGTIAMMEQVRTLVEQGIGQLGGRWVDVGSPSTETISGVPALMCEMPIVLMTERQT